MGRVKRRCDNITNSHDIPDGPRCPVVADKDDGRIARPVRAQPGQQPPEFAIHSLYISQITIPVVTSSVGREAVVRMEGGDVDYPGQVRAVDSVVAVQVLGRCMVWNMSGVECQVQEPWARLLADPGEASSTFCVVA